MGGECHPSPLKYTPALVLVYVSSSRTEITGLKQFDFHAKSVSLAESAILPIMLNQKIMNARGYGENKSGACFIEVKCSSTFSFAQTHRN